MLYRPLASHSRSNSRSLLANAPSSQKAITRSSADERAAPGAMRAAPATDFPQQSRAAVGSLAATALPRSEKPHDLRKIRV